MLHALSKVTQQVRRKGREVMKLIAAVNISSMTLCKFSSLFPGASITVFPKLWYFYTYNPQVNYLPAMI